MNKDQLKNSLHELTPSQDQKQAMLRNIRQAKPSRTPIRRYASAFVVIVLLFGVIRLLPSLLSQNGLAEEAEVAMMKGDDAAGTEAADVATTISAPREAPMELDWKDFEQELTETPWNAGQPPTKLPIFLRSELLSAQQKTAQPELFTKLSDGEQAIVTYAYGSDLVNITPEYQLTELVSIKTYAQAKDELEQQIPELNPSDITAGFLSYIPAHLGESELIPVYRFRYTTPTGVEYAMIPAFN